MKTLILCLALSSISASAFANVNFQGHCSVLQQPNEENPQGKILAYKAVVLKPGDIQTIYKQGDVSYQVTLTGPIDSLNKKVYVLETLITYGAPHFLGAGSATFTDATLASGAAGGAGVSLPGFPTFGCGNP